MLDGATLDFGVSIIEGSDIFEVHEGAGLATGHPTGFAAVDPKQVSFASNATYIFNGEERQETTFRLPVTVQNLTIDNEAGVDQSRSITVNGTLALLRGEFNNQFELSLGEGGRICTG